MPPFRNLFPKRPTVTVDTVPDENQPPSASSAGDDRSQRSSLNIRRSRDEPPNEYQMSVVNDSGVYLPPSPPEKRGFWPRSTSRNSNHRNLVNENEPFSISRESFDSYRRSFDISARSPISQSDTAASRTSLDSRVSRLTPRSTVNATRASFDQPPTTEEEKFEDVGLNDDPKPQKKGFFNRFTSSSAGETTPTTESNRPSSSHLGFHFPGRKRGQSGQGSELTSMAVSVPGEGK